MEHVIVERVFAEPVDLVAFERRTREEDPCFSARQIRYLRSSVSRDGLRMICEYLAPDAESVREANRNAHLPFERVWSALRFGAP
jgi:hypothetical protein